MLARPFAQVFAYAIVVHSTPDKFLHPYAASAVLNSSARGNDTTVVSGLVANMSTNPNDTLQASWGSYPVNLCWPPHAYASIADLGWADGFTDKGYTIENILGSSGGAASALLLLADPQLKSGLGKRVYKKAINDFWTQSDTYTYWKRVYEGILASDSSAFQRVKKGSKVALKCWDASGTGQRIVLYNFASPRQAAQAHAAAGDPGCHLYNCPVDGVWGHTANCADDGAYQVDAGFQSGQTSGNNIYYYSTGYLLLEGYGGIGYVDDLINKGKQDYANWAHSSNYGPAKTNTGYTWVNLR